MNPKDAYLVAYNAACCVGWAGVWILGVLYMVNAVVVDSIPLVEAALGVYPAVAMWLQVSQSAALMEIVHAAAGLVRSPVSVTFMQVVSRIVALAAIVYAPSAQGKRAKRIKSCWRLVHVCV